MNHLAFIFGIIFGLPCFYLTDSARLALCLFYLDFIKSKRNFYIFYDYSDTELCYKAQKEYCGFKIARYIDFLHLHQTVRPKAYEYFKRYYLAILRFLFLKVLPIVLLPAAYFWQRWQYYILGLLLSFAALLLGEIIIKNNNRSRNTIIIMGLVLSHNQEALQSHLND